RFRSGVGIHETSIGGLSFKVIMASPLTGSAKVRLPQLLRPYWKSLTVGLVAAAASTIIELLHPWPLKVVIDNVIGSRPIPQWLVGVLSATVGSDRIALLDAAAVSLAAIAIIGGIASYAESVLMTSAGQRVMHDLRTMLFHHVQRLPQSFHDSSRTGDLIGRVTTDVDTIQSFITSTLLDALINALTLVGIVAVMCYMNLTFTLIALSISPLLFAFVYKYARRIKRATRSVRRKESEIMSRL